MKSRSEMCQACGHRVEPTAEGFCPSCARRFVPAGEGQQHFEVTPPTGPYQSPTSRFLTKAAIVVFVFPTFGRLIQMLAALVLALPLLALPATWQAEAVIPIMVVTNLLGLVGAFLISRWCWPKPAPAVQR